MRTRHLALLVAAAGVAILLFGFMTPTTSDGGGGMNSGASGERTSYSVSNGLLIMVGSFIAATGISYWAFKEDYVPVPRPPVVMVREEKVEEKADEGPVVEGAHSPIAGEHLLVLRLLNGDERFMFRTIIDMGGEALQKDLIARTKMSDAKVSRVIDRLIEKGLVTKERYGVTNKVKISVEK
ncbi:MAG: MarR family transcriptional regulator [Methanomassiliicoccales archaeon]|nr:MAG: MarR family transcriptional regulator [Methanomassiliicoccales archaeon]